VVCWRIMRLPPREILSLLSSPAGRIRFRQGVWGHASFSLMPLASTYRRTLLRGAAVTAVTGTYGKTMTTRGIAGVLGLPVENHVGWNAGSFLASAVLRTPGNTARTVFEVSVSRPGMGARHASMIRPDITVVTSLGTSHHTSMGTIERTRDEKAHLVKALPPQGTAILNTDDPYVSSMAEYAPGSVMTFGLDASADFRAVEVRITAEGTAFTLLESGKRHRVFIKTMGEKAVHAALAAVAVAQTQGIPVQDAIEALRHVAPMPRRLEPILLPHGPLILDDSCQSGYETYDVALRTLRSLPGGRRLLVTGDLTEPLRPQSKQYRRLGREIGAEVDRIYHIGEKKAFTRIRAGACSVGMAGTAVSHVEDDLKGVVENLLSETDAHDVLLIKGRRGQHLERISLRLQGIPVRCQRTFCRMFGHCRQCPNLQ